MSRSTSVKVSGFVIALVALLARAAFATFPGANGEIAFAKPIEPAGSQTAIFGSRSGQLTFPGENQLDFEPAWSPDGKKIAFTRSDPGYTSGFEIRVLDVEAGTTTQLVQASVYDFDGHVARTYQPAWSADGQRIAFVVQIPGAPIVPITDQGIWSVRADGTDRRQIVELNFSNLDDPYDTTARNPEFSPDGRELAYDCSFRRTAGGLRPLHDLCILDLTTSAIREVRIDWPDRSAALPRDGGPKWFPDSRKLLIPVDFVTLTLEGIFILRAESHSEVFSVKRDGTGLERLTHSKGVCPSLPIGATEADFRYDAAAPMPDGESIVVSATRKQTTGIAPDGHCLTEGIQGAWWMGKSGGSPSLMVENAAGRGGIDAQPIPSPLIVKVDDGRGNPLQGLKLELFTVIPYHSPAGGRFVNNSGGSYAYEGPLAAQAYYIRATLVDDTLEPPSQPSFDIRLNPVLPAPTPSGPDDAGASVWLEQQIAVTNPTLSTVVSFSFGVDRLTNSNLSAANIDKLSDLAHIYFRVRQYVEWLKAELGLTDTGSTVHFQTFVTTDNFYNPPQLSARIAYYQSYYPQVVMGTTESTYENRDGLPNPDGKTDDGPENSEWHEFTHHLFEQFVASGVCPDFSGDQEPNHGGYSNYDTCDSMQEGFAAFLPAYAAQSILGASDSMYASLWDHEQHTKAWWWRRLPGRDDYHAMEDLAIAGLFWDLVDGELDVEETMVVDERGHSPASLRDDISIPLRTLWTQLKTPAPNDANPGTTVNPGKAVAYLRKSFGPQTKTIDLDNDLTPDVSPVDQLFLMHGFYYVIDEQRFFEPDEDYHYTLDQAIGRSDHVEYFVSEEQDIVLTPRNQTPVNLGADVGVSVRDASGTPIAGATIDIAVRHPDPNRAFPRISSRKLADAAGALHLELPPYWDYLLRPGAPLPPCDPASRMHVEVELTARVNGYASTDHPTFDNCTYHQSVVAGNPPSLTLTFPEDSTPPATTLDATATPGAVNNTTTGTFEVELACADPVTGGFATGCLRTEYRIDGGAITPYTEPFTVATPGSHFVEFRSIDAAANEETFRSVTLTVDPNLDSDGDGLSDAAEAVLGTNPNSPDSDNDGISDGAETSHGWNPNVGDSDGDGLWDHQEELAGSNPLLPDTDGDGLTDGYEATIDPPIDLTDPDSDDDGLTDGAEWNQWHTKPHLADTDADGLDDATELALGTYPNGRDSDNDRLIDGDEVDRGTDPLKDDTDGDGLTDGREVLDLHTDPLDLDTENDGVNDYEEVRYRGTNPLSSDTDGDGLGDGVEAVNGTNPLLSDTDADGASDPSDNCPRLANANQANADADALGDVCDLDDDGDGLVDGFGAQWRLVGVTGEGAQTPESLFEIDTATASSTFLMSLGNGGQGEAIGFDPVDGLLYHVSGAFPGERFWEKIDVANRSIVTSGQFPLFAQTTFAYESAAITYDPGSGKLLVGMQDATVFEVDSAGVGARHFFNQAYPMKGLAFVDGKLYSASRNVAWLYRMDLRFSLPLGRVEVTLAGSPVEGMNGLATHPVTGEMWGIFRQSGQQVLGKLDPATGVVTPIGPLVDDFQGLAFVPEPSGSAMLAAGAIALSLLTRRRPRPPGSWALDA